MIWFLKFLFFSQFLVNLQQLNVEAGYISWEIMELPLVFGEGVGIRCTYHKSLSCTDHIYWTWTTGTENDLIMTNSILSKKYRYEQKYSEIRSSCSQISTLVISNFNESDYKQLYTCSITKTNNSYVEYSNGEITFENISYTYVPAEEMIVTELQLKHQQIVYKVEIGKMYPLPECEGYLANINITNTLEVQQMKTGLFYNVAISSTIYNTSLKSIQDLCIICYGTGYRWYLTNSFNPYCTDTPFIDILDMRDFTKVSILLMDVNCVLYGFFNLMEIHRLFCSNKDRLHQKETFLENLSFGLIGYFGTIGFMEVITNVRGIQGKPFQYDYVCEIFSKIFFGILDICLIAVFIVTVLTVAELKITKMWKLCCFTITFIFLMAAVVFSTNIWIFIRTSDIYDVSFHVVMIPANLINCMLITTGKGYYVKLLNQMAKDRLKSESEENSHTCCTLLQKTDYKVQLEPVQKSKESTNL